MLGPTSGARPGARERRAWRELAGRDERERRSGLRTGREACCHFATTSGRVAPCAGRLQAAIEEREPFRGFAWDALPYVSIVIWSTRSTRVASSIRFRLVRQHVGTFGKAHRGVTERHLRHAAPSTDGKPTRRRAGAR